MNLYLYVFIPWLVLGIIANILIHFQEKAKRKGKSTKVWDALFWIFFIIISLWLLSIIGWVLYKVWYHLCGGMIVMGVADDFWDYILLTPVTILGLVFLVLFFIYLILSIFK